MKFWWSNDPPLWSWLLAPAALSYRAGTRLHRRFSLRAKASAPVISVGNLTVGGAGKTPVALFLSAKLAAAGRTPAILSRGYGRSSKAPLRVRPDTPVREAGDEPLLLARRGAQVWVGPRRAQLAELAVAAGADVLLLDDGLQHHSLERDLDIIVADATNPLGNGALLPQGPLRELPSALRRVRRGLLWLTRSDQPRHPRVSELASFPVVESAYQARADLRGRRVFAFAGIARPEGFLRTVLELGASVAGTRWFADHHFFTPGELRDLRRQDALLVTTEKDLVRIPPGEAEGIVPVPIDLRILRGEEHLDRALAEAT